MSYMKLKVRNRIIELEIESYEPALGARVSYAQYLDGNKEMLDQEDLTDLIEMYQDEIDEEAYEHMMEQTIKNYTEDL